MSGRVCVCLSLCAVHLGRRSWISARPVKISFTAGQNPVAPTTTEEEPAQVGGAGNETLKQKTTRIKVELRLGEDVTTVGDILRAANEAMGLTPDCLTLPQQASRPLAEIGI